jgi:aspartyl protease family protein
LFGDFWHEAHGGTGFMRTLLVISLLIGGIAVAMPSLFTSYMGRTARHASVQAAVPEASDETSATPATQKNDGSRQVEIRAERDGHFYVDANINLRPVRLMVDTGATVVALRASDAAAAGIRVRDADFVNPVQTANGTTNAAEALLESIAVSDIELHNVRALVVPDDRLAVSLLGGSFLHGLRRFEVADGTLVFEN